MSLKTRLNQLENRLAPPADDAAPAVLLVDVEGYIIDAPDDERLTAADARDRWPRVILIWGVEDDDDGDDQGKDGDQ